VDRDQQVGGIFHFRAVAELADEVVAAREAVQDWNGPVESGALAAAIDDQVLDPRLGAGAAQRAVEQRGAGGGKPLARRFLDRDRQGTGFDDDQVSMFFSCNFL